jgi:two-component system, chemotaxis family, CheB/CheR fusion protein
LKKIPKKNIAKKGGDNAGIDSAAKKSRIKAADEAALRIVGMGGSAGGLEAFEQFFSNMPSDTGMAFALVPHLDPTHKGIMPELLQRHTKMKVVQIEDGMQVQPNCIYVIPPNADLSMLHGRLHLLEPSAPRGLRKPIDFFFRQLADDQHEKAICIVLSGMGSDGAGGLKAIKENSGLAMVQDPASAKYDGMPKSAIGTGLVDYVGSAEELPAKLMQYVKHAPSQPEEAFRADDESHSLLQKVFILLRAHTGNDFSCYKNNTIHRRIERRMSVHQFDGLARYVRFLQENPQEIDLLYKELLIGVTNFFRDPGLFEFLKEKALPGLLESRAQGGPLRVWTPACSTGEETYSLAIVLKEALEEMHLNGALPIQFFATDIDKEAIDKARQGTFSASIALDISQQRLKRFFLHEGEGYRIKKEIRDTIIFAPQNILVDPPFTKLDILCCRNLLIYVNTATQKKLLPLLHYALNPGGLLILGSAESVGESGHLFRTLEKKWKIFQAAEPSERPAIEMPASMLPRPRDSKPLEEKNKMPAMDATYAAQRVLLDAYAPASVVINTEGDIVYVNGHTGKYLEPSSGKVNINVFAMAREGLGDYLRIAIHDAIKRNTDVVVNGVKIKTNGGYSTIDLAVKPLSEPGQMQGMLLVVFEDQAAGKPKAAAKVKSAHLGSNAPADEVNAELQRTKQILQNTVEEMEATQEELRSSNEELQSNNEELQSTNEELTTSKEELQSLNEEMQTVNAELQSKLEELAQSNNDMKNLLNGIDIATIFLDSHLNIKRFTSQATSIVNLIASDVGRPLGHIVSNLKYDRLANDVHRVLETLAPKELQVQSSNDRWYNMRILPYRTSENVIEGVVITFADITEIKRLEESLERQKADLDVARQFAEGIIATIREPLVVLDGQLRIVSASPSFYQTFQVSPGQTEGRFLYEICQRQWDIPALRQLLEDILPKNTEFEDFRVEHDFAAIGHKALLLNARRVAQKDRQTHLILLAMEDVGDKA